MRNIERYPGTKDAVEAWDTYHDGGGDMPFAAWAEQEYVDTGVPTLLEAAEAVADEWWTMDMEPNVRHGKIADLENAIAREKAKPVRNFDKYKTSKKACDGFNEMCKGVETCVSCRFNSSTSIAGCAIAWLYSEAEKEAPK